MIAIIIPYYKLAFFEETLQSLVSQSNKQFKVYIGDDASSENPTSLLDKFRDKLDFEYHHFETNLGAISLTKQWERCIALSNNEEWLMILGDDDYLEPNVVQAFYDQYENFNKDSCLVRFASKVFRQQLNAFSKIYTHPQREKASDSYFRKFQLHTRSSLSEYVFKRESYEQFHFKQFPLAWYSDDLAWLEFSNNKKIFTINEAVVVLRLSNYNISGKLDNLEDKENAKFLFFNKIINNQLFYFNAYQREIILLEYAILAIAQKRVDLDVFKNIVSKLMKNGSLYALAKFIRRLVLAKIKSV